MDQFLDLSLRVALSLSLCMVSWQRESVCVKSEREGYHTRCLVSHGLWCHSWDGACIAVASLGMMKNLKNTKD